MSDLNMIVSNVAVKGIIRVHGVINVINRNGVESLEFVLKMS